MLRNKFYDSLKKILFAFVAMIFIAPAFSATLPAGYTELEYIESTGIQSGITTGVSGFDSGNWEIYAKWMTISAPLQNYAYVFNVYQSEEHNTYRTIFQLKSATNYLVSANTKAGGGSVVKSASVGQINTVTVRTQNHAYTFNGDSGTVSVDGTTLDSGRTLYVIGANTNIRLYEITATKDGDLKYNGIPARNSDGAVGLYDTVSGTFKTSTNDNNFIAGPDIIPPCNLYTTTNSTSAWFDASGIAKSTSGYVATDYIPISPNTEYTVYVHQNSSIAGHGVRIVFFDSNKTFISPRMGGDAIAAGDYIYNITSPSNAAYIRISTANTSRGVNPVIITAGTFTTNNIPTDMKSCYDTIKIATTKYNEDAFADLITTLNSAITKVTNIVDTTVAQASSIGTLATTKQDRPADGDCPAGRKCLLVTGTDGKPHWYLIQE